MKSAALDKIDRLLDEVIHRTEQSENQSKKDAPHPRFTVSMENIGWAQLFDFDMNEFYGDPVLNFEVQLRQKLFHLDNFDEDTVVGADISASVGMYFEYTLFGMNVEHESHGVPHIQADHPLTKSPDLKLMRPHDFYSSGAMPDALSLYDELLKIAEDRVQVGFATWQRGPLDLAIQLRGYENFIQDTIERPQFVHDLMRYINDERMRWHEAYHRHFDTKSDSAGIADDWINVPFISPAIFRDFVLPYYLDLERFHGKIHWVHSCGDQAPLQKYLLEIKSLDGFEVNSWTSLEETVRNVPSDKWLSIQLANFEVLTTTEQEIHARLHGIVDACQGRNYGVSAGGLQKIHESYDDDIGRIKTFIGAARDLLRG